MTATAHQLHIPLPDPGEDQHASGYAEGYVIGYRRAEHDTFDRIEPDLAAVRRILTQWQEA